MKLSCLPVSFFADILSGRMSVGAWARLGAELGLDAVDLSILFVPERTPACVSAVRREIESAGMRVAMVTSYPDFTHPDSAQRFKELELAVEVCQVAADLGAELVRVTAGQAHPQTGRAEGICWAVEGLTGLVERTQGLAVTPVYENHAKPGAWEFTDFSQPPEIFLEIVHRTAECRLRVNFDTGNAAAFSSGAALFSGAASDVAHKIHNAGSVPAIARKTTSIPTSAAPDTAKIAGPVGLLEAVLDRVTSVHASDTAASGALIHVLLGTGITPFRELFASLKRQGWDGWICMEEASNQGREGVAKAASFIRKIWQES